MLSVFEELFLLALDEEKGIILPSAKKNLAHGLTGGILSELALRGKIQMTEKRRLQLVDADPTGDPLLDEAINEIKSSEKLRKPAYWISQLSTRPKTLRQRIGESLVGKGILYQEDKRFFWGSPDSEEPALKISAKFEMKYPLRVMVFSAEESDLHKLALLNVVSAVDMLNLVFTVDELQMARKNIHEKVVRSALEKMSMQTIEEIEQAIITSLEDDLE
jgi:Golgi phosphoprotein 3